MKKAEDFRKAFGPAEAGFERTIQNTLSRLLSQEQKSAFRKLYRFRIPALATAMVLLLSIGVLAFTGHLGFSVPDQTRSGSAQYTVQPIETALSGGTASVGSGEPDSRIREAMEGYVPGIADRMHPVGAVRENQGIRVELQSVLLKGRTEYIRYSVQDLEGSRVNSESLGDCLNFEDSFDCSKQQTVFRLDYDDAQHRADFLLINELNQAVSPGMQMTAFTFSDLLIRDTADIDLLPLLKQYGKETEGVDLPEDAMDIDHPGTTYLKQQKYRKVLDYTRPLDTPLFDSVTLSGIGWVDGRLHVQIHNPDPKSIAQADYIKPTMSSSVFAKYTDPENSPDVEDDILGWSFGANQEPAWQEFIFEFPPEDVDRLELTAHLSCLTDAVRGKWEFQVKPELLTDSSLEAEAAAEEEDPAEFRLWAFFDAWSENDYDRMARLSTPEWRSGEEDASGKLRSMMEGRKILGYQIHSITGTDGDPERTADCTLQISRPGSAEPQYEAFRTSLNLGTDGYYDVDPAALVFAGAREPDPAVEMEYLTEEAQINDQLAFSLGDARKQMVPLNLSIERQGIRLEVISGLARARNIWLLCTVEDLEGKYNGSYLSPFFTADDYASYMEECVYHDYDGNRYTYFLAMEAYNPVSPYDSVLTFSMDHVCPGLNAQINLNSILKQYGTAAEGAALPKLLRNEEGLLPAVPADLKVLDWQNPMDIPAVGGIRITGIGWIDGQLHIQFHYAVDALVPRSGVIHYSVAYLLNDDKVTEYSPLEWDDDNDGYADWREYVFDCKPEDIDRTDLTVDFSSPVEILDDDWSLRIPLSDIYVNLGQSPEETAAMETQKLDYWSQDRNVWSFFTYWAGGNVNSMLEISASQWKSGTEDPRADLAEIMAKGTPLSYQVNSVSGEYFDPELTLTCTVLFDRKDGTAPQYERFDLVVRNENYDSYAVDPASMVSMGPAESDPALETFSLAEDDIIRRNIEITAGDIFDKLIPVNLSCESSGIRAEILSAAMTGYKTYIVYSLEDMEGRYPGFELYSELSDTLGTHNTYSSALLYANEAEHRSVWMCINHYEDRILPDDRQVILSSNYIYPSCYTWLDLAPLVKQYGKSVEGIAPPENISTYAAPVPEGMKILDSAQPLDIPLFDNVTLSGIGWIDGQLHIQLHSPHLDFISFLFKYGWTVPEQQRVPDLETPFSPMMWNNESGYWREYVLNYIPEYTDRVFLGANIYIGHDSLSGFWKFSFPLSSITPELAGNAADDATDPESGDSYNLFHDDPDRDLYMNYLQKHAVPLNLVCEKNGIRFELISAAAMGKYLYYSYSLQDLEGDRVNKTIEFSAYEPYAITDLDHNGATTWRLSENPAKRQAVYGIFLTLDQPLSADGRPLDIGLDTLYASEGTDTDLLPLLKQYATTEEGSDLPGDAFVPYSGITSVSDLAAKGLRVLDPGRQLDIPLFGDVTLTGIGWVDGHLHVRLRNADAADNADLWNINAPSWPTDGMSPFAWHNEYSPIHMDRNSTLEFISGAAPQDADRMELRAYIEHITGTTEGPWNVEVPLSSICLEEVDIKALADAYSDTDTFFEVTTTPSPAKYYLNGIAFSLADDGTAYVSGTSESGWKKEEIEIPAAVSGHPVTAVAPGAFTNNPNLKRLTLPDTVISIGSYAFMNSALQSINLPSGITTIGTDAFSGCRNLVCNVTVNSYAFQYCSDSGIGIVFE